MAVEISVDEIAGLTGELSALRVELMKVEQATALMATNLQDLNESMSELAKLQGEAATSAAKAIADFVGLAGSVLGLATAFRTVAAVAGVATAATAGVTAPLLAISVGAAAAIGGLDYIIDRVRLATDESHRHAQAIKAVTDAQQALDSTPSPSNRRELDDARKALLDSKRQDEEEIKRLEEKKLREIAPYEAMGDRLDPNRAASVAEKRKKIEEELEDALYRVADAERVLHGTSIDTGSTRANAAAQTALQTVAIDKQAASIFDLAAYDALHAEAVLQANTTIKQSSLELAAAESERQDAERAAASQFIGNLEQEIELLQLRADGQHKAADELALERELIEKLGVSYGLNREQIEQLTQKKKELTEQVEKQKKAEEEAEKAAKKAAEKIQAIWDKAGNDLFAVWKDGWRSVLSGNLKDFDDFAKKIGQIGLNLVAELMAQQSKNWLQEILFGAGGSPGNAGGAQVPTNLFSGGINDFGTRLGFSAPGGGAAGSWTSATLGQVVGAGAIGYMGGSLFGDLVGMRNPGNAGLGAGGGAMIGMAMGGPWGALLGGAIGSAAGLLGPRPSDRTEGVNFNLATGAREWGNLGANKRDPANEASARRLDESITKFYQALSASGFNPSAQGGLIEVGAGNSLAPYRVSLDASGVQSFNTEQEAFAFLANALVDTLGEVPARLQAAVDNFDASNIDAFIAELERVASFDKSMAAVNDEIKRTTDPRQWELDKLAEEFKALREQAVAFADQAAIDAIDQLIAMRTKDIDGRYGVSGKKEGELGPGVEEPEPLLDDGFTDMLRGVRDELARVVDPKVWELGELEKRYKEMRDLAEEHGEGLAEIEEWYGQQRSQISDKYAQEAARQARELLEQIAQEAREGINQQLEVLSQQRQAVEESVGQYKGVLDSIKSARSRIMNDPRTSSISNEQRLADLMAQLNAAAAKAQAGDMEAAAEVADLAVAAADANVAFNASSEEGARIQAQIATILDNTGSVANRQLQVAELSLAANEAQVQLLQQQLETIDKSVTPARRAATADDFARISTSFGNAKANALAKGITDEQFVNSAIYAGIKNELFDMIASTTDKDFLLSDLNNAIAHGAGTDAYAAASSEREGRIRDRLHELGVPGYARGGRTGNLAIVHPNEMIYTGPPAMVYNARETASMMTGGNVLRELQGIRADIGVLSRTVSITGEDQVVQLSRHYMRLAAIESNFSLARARS